MLKQKILTLGPGTAIALTILLSPGVISVD